MIETGPDYVQRPRGYVAQTYWDEITVGYIVRDKNDRFHTVTKDDGVFVTLVPAHGRDPVVSITRPPDDREVSIYVPSEQEAIELLHEELGARLLRDIEEREHTIARAANWKLEPCEPDVKSLRDHIDMIHGQAKVDTLLSQYNPSTKPTTKEGRAKLKARRAEILQEMLDMHVEMHQDPHVWPMAFPHTHTLEAS